jgi:hypothetical protein
MNPPDQPALAPTPRTLEAAGTPSHDWEATADRLFIESQKLERELAAEREKVRLLREALEKYQHTVIVGGSNPARAALAAAGIPCTKRKARK